MQTRIREVRKAKGLTLQEVASRCTPPTTAQTIGRLETGTRTVSMGWLNRIARALDVDPSELVHLPDRPEVPVGAVLGASGVERPRRATVLTPPRMLPDLIGLTVEVSQGDYRAGDEVWLTRLAPPDYARCLNRDVLVPLPARLPDDNERTNRLPGSSHAADGHPDGSRSGETCSDDGHPRHNLSGGNLPDQTSGGDASGNPPPEYRSPDRRIPESPDNATRHGSTGGGSEGGGPTDGGSTGDDPTGGGSAGNGSAGDNTGRAPDGGASAGGLVFGRLVSVTATDLQVAPLAWGTPPLVLPTRDWIAVVSTLVRKLS